MKFQLLKSSLIFCFTLIFFSACTPEKNELWVNKDGSGKSVVTIDMGEMASMAMEMAKMMDENSEDADTTPSDAGMWDKEEKMDTIINLYDTMPDSVKQSLSSAELIKKINFRMSVDSEKEYAKMFVEMSYDSHEEMKAILRTFNEAKAQGGGGAMGMMSGDDADLSSMFNPFTVDYKNGVIRIEGFDAQDMKDDPEYGEMIEALDDPAKTDDPEFMEMFQMMIGGDMETVIHAPGKILFTNDMDALIDGKTVTFKDNMIDLIKEGKSSDRVIKYKK